MTEENKIALSLLPINIEDEMRQSYVDYAMSVIVGRALPDIRDGLKPVHRRVLFAMKEMGVEWNKSYKKSARVVGDVVGKYHPHGETAVYDTLVRMAQLFSLRYILVDGQGNFGSVDGDAPAAMRYTEVRMARITSELLADIDQDTVDFAPNYDNSEREPTVLPACFPNLLVNGSSGIAVGMATNIPPHNLSEVIDACIASIDDPSIGIDGLLQHIKGPDFPTAGIISGIKDIHQAYYTGRGRVLMRARTKIEESNGNSAAIVVTELPYQVNKARLLEKIAELVKEKKIDGIRELRDESDKDGMRMVIELRRGEIPEVILNNLFQFTVMQSVFNVNMVMLTEGQPRLLNLKEMLDAFIRHRREVVVRRTRFQLGKARQRAHILEGLAVALDNIDAMVALIKRAPTPANAKQELLAAWWRPELVKTMLSGVRTSLTQNREIPEDCGLGDKGYRLTEVQTQAILEMRLQRLTGLERDKILSEFKQLIITIQTLLEILEQPSQLMTVIRNELLAIKEQYGDARLTEIVDSEHRNLTIADLTPRENVVITLSHVGYAKRQALDVYHTQNRGGRGKMAADIKEKDFIDQLFIANTHDFMLCFSSLGKVYWLKVYDIPEASRTSRGKPIANLLPLQTDERITAILPVSEFSDDRFVFMATAHGTVKKCPLQEFSRPRANGIKAIELDEGNRLVAVSLTDGAREAMLFSDTGKVIRFKEADVRAMGRTAKGVRGIALQKTEHVISLVIIEPGAGTHILTATEKGYGKRTPIDGYPQQRRGGKGVVSIRLNERNGKVVYAIAVRKNDEVILISDQGTLVRLESGDISSFGRNTAGVRLLNLKAGKTLAGIGRILSALLTEESVLVPD